MFSWSNSRPKGRTTSVITTTTTTTYPAQRTHNNSAPPALAQPVRGSIRPPQYTRQQHLDSYLSDEILKRSTRNVSSDDSTYDTVFQTTSGHALILRVHLPHSDARPGMTLVGVRARHSWLDARMRVSGYAALESDDAWKQAHLLLGQAVHQVVQHFQLQPPEILEFTDPGLQRLQTTLPSSSGRRGSSAGASGENGAPPDYNSLFQTTLPEFPTIPSRFDDLIGDMSLEELRDVQDDEFVFLQLVNMTPAFCELQSLSTSVLEENVKAAEENLKQQEELKELHEETTSLQKTLEGKLEEYDMCERQYRSLCAPPDTKDVIRRLQKAKRQALDDSEALAEQWVDSNSAAGTIQDFLESFLETRTLHHVRAAKMERLQQESMR